MKRTYPGACHCGAARFEVDADIDHVRVCDCSICTRRGARLFRVAEEDMRLLTPLGRLSAYRWGSRTAVDYFCPVCSVLPFRRPSRPTAEERARGVAPFDGWAVNTLCLAGFDPSSVPIRPISGRALRTGD
jgi:hypothetical protein